MKQTARIISTYSADVMGVCSALFELGGMTVMHDASGCNSTYTTHDEPRWFDMDSMIYISGLSEIEAIMGDDEKLFGDIEETAAAQHPAFIAISGSPISAMTGFDYEAAAEVLEQRTGIPCFGFPTTGMNTYVHGVSMAFEKLTQRLVDEPDEKSAGLPLGVFSAGSGKAGFLQKVKVNIIGLTPLDFSVNGTDRSLAEWLEGSGFEVVSKWAMGSTLDELRRSGEADVDLVVSASGIAAAEVLRSRCGIPYVVGMPIGSEQSSLLKQELMDAALVSRAAGHTGGRDAASKREPVCVRSDLEGRDVILIGEGVTNLALATAIELETGRPARILCATECPDGILRAKDAMTPDEDDIIPELTDAKVIIADPLYRPICPDSARFIGLPSEAFSGRIYRNDIPDLIRSPEAVLDLLK